MVKPCGSIVDAVIPRVAAAALSVALFGCGTVKDVIEAPSAAISDSERFSQLRFGRSYPTRRGKLTEREYKMAETAWKYFENNLQETTGLVNAVNDYPSTTLWDTASYLGGMVAAYELGIIERDEFSRRMVKILKTFNAMEFFRGELPNKVYHTQTAAKVNYANQDGEIGYSALDLGRLLIWLEIIKNRYPEFSNAIDNYILRWDFCNVVDERGVMYGAIIGPDDETQYVQEGRLGYEEYAAKGFQLWDIDTSLASKPEPFSVISTYGVTIPYDSRDPRELDAHNYVVSESYVLDGLEMNWDYIGDDSSGDGRHTDTISARFGNLVYEAQVARYNMTGILTARTEHQLDGPPYFVYDTVYTDGYAWNTITEDGKHVPQFAAIALKGALGMWAVWKTDYTDLLFDAIADLYNPEKGFYEGLYENGAGVIETYTANNNGIMLEALLYKEQGKLLRPTKEVSLWDQTMSDEFLWDRQNGKNKCFPTSRLTGADDPKKH